MSMTPAYRLLAAQALEHSSQLLIAIDQVLDLTPQKEDEGLQAHTLLKMISELEVYHNAEMNQSIDRMDLLKEKGGEA